MCEKTFALENKGEKVEEGAEEEDDDEDEDDAEENEDVGARVADAGATDDDDEGTNCVEPTPEAESALDEEVLVLSFAGAFGGGLNTCKLIFSRFRSLYAVFDNFDSLPAWGCLSTSFARSERENASCQPDFTSV